MSLFLLADFVEGSDAKARNAAMASCEKAGGRDSMQPVFSGNVAAKKALPCLPAFSPFGGFLGGNFKGQSPVAILSMFLILPGWF